MRNLFFPGSRITHRSFYVVVVFALFTWIGAVTAVQPAAAQDNAPSNLELMTGLGTDVVEEIVENIGSQIAGRGIRLHPIANTEHYRLLDNVFLSVLRSRGVRVYDQSAKRPDAEGAERAPLVLEYETLEFNLAYDKVYRSHLIGGKRVKRQADLKVLAKLVNSPDAEVLWIGEATAGKTDRFSFSEINRIETGTFQFTKPAKPTTGWGKLVEPVFVSGIIVGMIYLFFSNQSDA